MVFKKIKTKKTSKFLREFLNKIPSHDFTSEKPIIKYNGYIKMFL